VRLTRITIGATSALLALFACESGSSSGDGDFHGAPRDGISTSDPVGTEANSTRELELEEDFRSPVVSGPFLWSANPETNRVARIDARSFAVEVLDGGHAPTYLEALPIEGAPGGALTLNAQGQDASIFRPGEAVGMGGRGASVFSEVRVEVQRGASAWTVGERGKFAIAWSRFEEDLRGPLDGYQYLTILSLGEDEPRAEKISVGYRPTQVLINRDETRAFVVSDPGISVIDLTAEVPEVIRELELPASEGESRRDVSFTPDGELALVRLPRSETVLLIRTQDNERVQVELPREVTDLDLSDDGTVAVAVMRGELSFSTEQGGGQGGGAGAGQQSTNSQIALIEVPEIFANPSAFEVLGTPELVGSAVISGDGSVVLLYTSAVANSFLTILEVDSGALRTVDLQAPAQAAFISDDGRYAVAIMTPPSGSMRSGAFAMVPVFDALPLRIQGTETVPRFISLHNDRVIVTTWGSQSIGARTYLGKFPDLSIDRFDLTSEPLATGMIPEASQAFVAQSHPEGRVTFFSLDSPIPSPVTVTGFELANQVVDK